MREWSASLPKPSRFTPSSMPSTTCTAWTFTTGGLWFRTAFRALRSSLLPWGFASKQQPQGDQVRQVLAFAKPHYDWTLVDLGRSLSRLGMAALEDMDEACLVTTLEVPALHQAKQIIQTLLDSGYGKNRIRLILNRAPKRLDITPGELEKMLGVPIFFMIPNDYPELYETYAEGRMLNRNSELGKQIAKMALKLAGLEIDEKSSGKKRFFSF